MKKIIYPTLLIMAILVLVGCTVTSETPTDQSKITGAATNVHEATLDIEGMTCTSCALGVEYQLKQVDGVLEAKINYEEGKGYVTYDADKVTGEIIAQSSDIYPAKLIDDKKVIE